MKTVKYILLVAFAAFFASCSDDTEVITVASKRACYCDFTGWVVPTFIYKTGNNGAWKTASEINGFVYEPGYEYVLEVTWHERDPRVQDAASSYMQVERVVSKTQKETTFPSTFQMKIYDESWSAQKPCGEVFGND